MTNSKLMTNWGYAEIMAYASLLSEGYPIRITGQDVRRGTFSHRHACIFDSKTGNGHIPLAKIAAENKTKFDIMIHYYLKRQYSLLSMVILRRGHQD